MLFTLFSASSFKRNRRNIIMKKLLFKSKHGIARGRHSGKVGECFAITLEVVDFDYHKLHGKFKSWNVAYDLSVFEKDNLQQNSEIILGAV
jgi:hypothetical protein